MASNSVKCVSTPPSECVPAHPRVDSLHGVVDQVADAVGGLPAAIVLNLKHTLFRLAEQLAGFKRFIVGVFEDRGAGLDQLAIRRLGTHDLSIIDSMSRIGDAIGQLGQYVLPPTAS